MTALLTDNLPLLAGAPNGIKKLRELILELAVRGKLVPQDPSDEPASELLKRIAEEKARLVAEGKIRKQKALPIVREEDFSFPLPEGWSTERLGGVSHLITKGTTPTTLGHSYTSSGVNFVKVENIEFRRISIGAISQFISEETDELMCRSRLEAGDVLFSIAGTIGKVCLVSPSDLPANTNQALAIIRGTATVFVQEFLLAQLDSFVSEKTKQRARGGAMPNVSLGDLSDLVLVIPPLAEQHRIVAKVDELMALCDSLEARQADAASAHARLVQALLDSLTQASDAADFASSWQRLAEHFHSLFASESSIDALKQTLLQLAVMGKLVPQDSSDESASKLLAYLAEDSKKYAARHKVASSKLEPIPFPELRDQLPSGWAWSRLSSMFRVITDGDHQPPPKSNDGVAFLTIGNVTKGKLDFSGCRFVPRDYFEKIATYRRPELGDILYTVVGATYGRPVAVDSAQEFCVQRHIAILKSSELINSKFACYLLESPWVYKQASQSITGTAQPTVPLRPLRNFLVMLPPLAEQHRIVAKLDQLLALCDQLKTRLTQARQLNEQLASTLVEQAVA